MQPFCTSEANVKVFLSFLLVSHCVTGLVSERMSDVETVTPHAVVGYCIYTGCADRVA